MMLLSIFFGVQFSLMAIVGEYLHRIYTESMQRPLYFVSGDTEHPRGTSRCGSGHCPPATPGCPGRVATRCL